MGWRLTFNPAAGYILNVADDAEPGPISASEKSALRDLAREVCDISAQPAQEARRDLWYRHNDLERVRPLVLLFLEDSWQEVLPTSVVQARDPFWGQWEWYLKHLLYRHEHLLDDFVVEPDLHVSLITRSSGWGLPPAEVTRPAEQQGAYRWVPPLQDPADLEKLTPATFEVDEPATRKRFDALCDVFGDMLPVHIDCGVHSFCVYDVATHLRGIDQCMLDMYDRPEWLHELMSFLAEDAVRKLEFLEDEGHLTLNNRNHYVDSGGIGYTRDLPADDAAGEHVRLRDRWCHCAAQAASEIGPDQHEEFILEYDLRVMERCGLNAYGCCEPYTNKFDMLKRRVPRLRRVSVSPWCDVERAAEALGDEYLFSWKPNPAMLVGEFDPEKLRPYFRRTLEVARDCVLEIILKDAITVEGQPQRLEQWVRVLREEIDGVWG